MSFHVRIFKHNLLKFSRLRAVAYTTEVIDKNADNECSSKPGKIWPSKNSMENLPVLLDPTVNKHVTSLLAQSLSATQSLPGLYEKKAVLPLLMSDFETFLFGNETYNKINEANDTGSLLDYLKPVSYTTDDILTPSHYVDSVDYTTLSDTVISQENVSVTLLRYNDNETVFKQQLGLMNDINPKSTNDHVMLCSADESKGKDVRKPAPGQSDLPTHEQLHNIKATIVDQAPLFFKEQLEYRIYHPHVILENNFWGKNKIYQGLSQYAVQILKFRALAHLHYAQVGFKVISISSRPEDGTIHLRWRVSGLPQLKALFFWKYTPWSYKKNIKKDSNWHDGISTFTLKSDGLIHKHRIDRIMVDEDRQEVKETTFAAKLAALMLGLAPKSSLGELSSIFMKKSTGSLNPK